MEEPPIRPSPYRNSNSFVLVEFAANMTIILSFVGAGICAVLTVGAIGTDDVQMSVLMFRSGFNLVVVAIGSMLLKMILMLLISIEEHTFRAAQCLDAIVESQTKKRPGPTQAQPARDPGAGATR